MLCFKFFSPPRIFRGICDPMVFLRKGIFCFLGLCCLGLSGCGFRPLYSETQPVRPALRHVKIALIQDRLGQQLRNRLLDLITPEGKPVEPRYNLVVTLTSGEREVGFSKSLVARRKMMHVAAQVSLVHLKTGNVIFTTTAEAHTSFALGTTSTFDALSSYTSEQDSQARLVEILAQDIHLQLSSFLEDNEGKKESR